MAVVPAEQLLAGVLCTRWCGQCYQSHHVTFLVSMPVPAVRPHTPARKAPLQAEYLMERQRVCRHKQAQAAAGMPDAAPHVCTCSLQNVH